MGKKKKKKSSDKPKKSKKKLKKKLIKLFIFGIIVTSGIALWKPDLIQNPQQRARVESMRESMLGFATNIISRAESDNQKVLGAFSNIKENLPEDITIGGQEIIVEQVIGEVASQLETLPADQYTKFRASFCADLVATASSQSSQ